VPKPVNILFLCTGNSCRSQMAEGWAWHFGGERLEVQSAGIEAHGKNPRAIGASAWRKWLMRDEKGETRLKRVLDRMHPVSLSALLITLILLFGFQGSQITSKPIIILLLAIPILIQVYFNSGLAYWLNKKLGEEHCVAGPSALIGASNFFELAVATAISIFLLCFLSFGSSIEASPGTKPGCEL